MALATTRKSSPSSKQAKCTDRGLPDFRPRAVRVNMGMLGTPMDVKRPLLALKIHGSRCVATCRIIHVIPAEVEIQRTKRSDIFALFENNDLARGFPFAHPVEGVVDFGEFYSRRDHFIQVQSAIQIEVDVLGHVETEAV
jgi:hypothetical protein